jgi:geranylgeranyl reductase family protein
MENPDFDVIICGGGPGGSACALGFVDTDIKVVVIEKSTFPREKVCGDGLAPYIPKALNKMSPRFKEAFDNFKERMPVDFVKVTSYNGKSATLPCPESWFISTRYHFDNFLYQQASAWPNVTYCLEEQVLSVSVTEQEVKVRTDKNRTFTGKLLIGCDGASSIVRRQLTDYQIDPSNHCVAVRAYYSNVEEVKPNTLEFLFIPKYPKSYFWIFPSEKGNANVGFALYAQELTAQKLKLGEIFLQIIDDTPHLKKRFKDAGLLGKIQGWSIPLGYGKHEISGLRFMLVGDAASIADPVSGEGIGQAIVTGRIAAFYAKDCFVKNDFSARFLKGYDTAVDQKWGDVNRKHRYFAEVIPHKKWLVNFLLKSLSGHNLLSKLLLKLILKIAS